MYYLLERFGFHRHAWHQYYHLGLGFQRCTVCGSYRHNTIQPFGTRRAVS